VENRGPLWYRSSAEDAANATWNHPTRAERCGARAEAVMKNLRYAPRRRPLLLTVRDAGQTAIIMIGPVRGPEHLAVIHDQRFYHVPVAAIAASRIGVGFIAFYEPASRFRADAGAIREYAEVVRVSRVRRGDLPGLTWRGRGNEDTPYYRFDLGPMLSLPQPITNPERLRVAFRFPDVARFRQAASIRDLGRGGRGASRPPAGTSAVRSSGARKKKTVEDALP
jgi:hypothetical protein